MEDFRRENRQERECLEQILGTMPPEMLARKITGEWTVAQMLLHMAFWDLVQLRRLQEWVETGVEPVSAESPGINDVVALLTVTVDGREAVRLVLEAAAAVDRAVEALPDEVAQRLVAESDGWPVRRYEHRRHHREVLERALEAWRA